GAPREAADGNIVFCRYLTTTVPQATTAAEAQYVVQYLRPAVSRHDLRRKPRAGDRLRRRWLPARSGDQRGGDLNISRQAPARTVAVHDPAARARQRENPLRRAG